MKEFVVRGICDTGPQMWFDTIEEARAYKKGLRDPTYYHVYQKIGERKVHLTIPILEQVGEKEPR